MYLKCSTLQGSISGNGLFFSNYCRNVFICHFICHIFFHLPFICHIFFHLPFFFNYFSSAISIIILPFICQFFFKLSSLFLVCHTFYSLFSNSFFSLNGICHFNYLTAICISLFQLLCLCNVQYRKT